MLDLKGGQHLVAEFILLRRGAAAGAALGDGRSPGAAVHGCQRRAEVRQRAAFRPGTRPSPRWHPATVRIAP